MTCCSARPAGKVWRTGQDVQCGDWDKCGSFLKQADSEAYVRKCAWTCESTRQLLIFSFRALVQLSSIFFNLN